MGKEIEIKLKIKDNKIDSITDLLYKKCGTPNEILYISDTYYLLNLRMRAIYEDCDRHKTKECFVTLKEDTKFIDKIVIRDEWETSVADAEVIKKVIERLKTPMFIIEKSRINWAVNGCVLSYDRIQNLGCFIEIEGSANQIKFIMDNFRFLEYGTEQTESYSKMYEDFLKKN